MSTFGPAYDAAIDGKPIRLQHEEIRTYMLGHGGYRTLSEIASALAFPEASVSAQLRHLKKRRFGSFRVIKRRREGFRVWEYRVLEPITEPIQTELFKTGNE